MKTLQEIALFHKTDKHQYGYLEHYERHFAPQRLDELNILEIGVKRAIDYPPYSEGAASLKTWKDYFPNSNIYGLDIDPKNKEYEEERIEVFIGNQGDPDILKEIGDRVGHVDIIIDDGSHVNSLTIASWEGLFPILSSGGLYIIEDLACTYENLDAANVREKAKANQYWWGMHLLPEDYSYKNNRVDMIKFFEERISLMDLATTRYAPPEMPGGNVSRRRVAGDAPAEISSMAFYPMMCFMTKV